MGLAQKTFGEIITFTRNSAATRFNHLGQLETAAANQPRIDYDPVTRISRGVLIEGQRTRINTISLAPTNPEVIAVTARAYTLSFYGTGSVSITGAHSQTVVGTGNFPSRTVYTFTPAAGSVTLSYSGACADVQLEAGGFASSIIRGEGAQVTRAADVLSINNLNFYNAAESTIFIEWSTFNNSVGTAFNLNDRFQVRGGTSFDQSQVISGAFSGWSIWLGPPLANNVPQKQAFRLKNGDGGYSRNGSAASVASALNQALPSRIELGHYSNVEQLFGHIREFLYFPRAMTNAQLQALTA